MSGCSRCASEVVAVEAERLPRIAEALAHDDLDLALSLGLLDWNGCEDCASAAGLAPGSIALLSTARSERIRALAARARYRNRQQRLQRRQAERALKRAAAAFALPPAAAAALARAKARAQKP